jgi:hypothetical protein
MALPVISWLFMPKIPAKKDSGKKQMVTTVKSIIVRPWMMLRSALTKAI